MSEGYEEYNLDLNDPEEKAIFEKLKAKEKKQIIKYGIR
jgi:hypothetical protein